MNYTIHRKCSDPTCLTAILKVMIFNFFDGFIWLIEGTKRGCKEIGGGSVRYKAVKSVSSPLVVMKFCLLHRPSLLKRNDICCSSLRRYWDGCWKLRFWNILISFYFLWLIQEIERGREESEGTKRLQQYQK